MCAVLFMVLLSFFTMQKIPGIQENIRVADHIKFLFSLESAYIVNPQTQEGKICRVVFTKKSLSDAEREKLMDAIGSYVWSGYAFAYPPSRLEVVHETRSGWGCSRRVVRYRKTVPPPGKTMQKKEMHQGIDFGHPKKEKKP